MNTPRLVVLRAFVTVWVLSCLTPAAVAAEQLMSASSGDHGWFVVEHPTAQARFELHHYARTMDGPHYNTGLALGRMPRVMAAWGNQLWLIFEEARRREVFTVGVHHNPVLGVWQHQPPDRLRAVARIEHAGEIVAAAGTPQGPLVLLRGSSPRLIQLVGRNWREIPLPDAFDPGGGCRLVVGGPRGRRILLLDAPIGSGGTMAHWRDPDGGWTRNDVGIVPGRLLEQVTSVGPAIVLVLADAGAGQVEVAYMRPWQLLPLAELDLPAGPWTVLGLSDRLLLVETDRGAVSMRRIDPVTGGVSESRPMTPQPVITGRLLFRPLLLAVAITALMLVLVFRPQPADAVVTLPASLVLMGPVSRLLAAGIDLGVAAGLTLVVLGCPATDLLDLPLVATDIARAVPFIVAAAITVGHSTLAEMATGRTLGKMLLGGRVVNLDGSRPRPLAILVRNGFKFVVLLIPVLAVVALMNPNAQGFGDKLARTLVVTDARCGAER
jgi:uncharacterized RDD family membrane protein YckC